VAGRCLQISHNPLAICIPPYFYYTPGKKDFNIVSEFPILGTSTVTNAELSETYLVSDLALVSEANFALPLLLPALIWIRAWLLVG
jgi:hypothetical protein